MTEANPLQGFANARAIGFEVVLEGVAHHNEAHFLLFESATHKYVISILTPSESASGEIYQANTKAMATPKRRPRAGLEGLLRGRGVTQATRRLAV